MKWTYLKSPLFWNMPPYSKITTGLSWWFIPAQDTEVRISPSYEKIQPLRQVIVVAECFILLSLIFSCSIRYFAYKLWSSESLKINTTAFLLHECVLTGCVFLNPKWVKEFENPDLETLSCMLSFNHASNPSRSSTTHMFKFKHRHRC